MIKYRHNVPQIQKKILAIGTQMPFALSKAINDTAYAAQRAVTDQMRARFDRPTAYTLRTIGVERSTKEKLSAYVGLKDDAPGKGSNWRDVLAHHFIGGSRIKKKSEYALVNKGQFQGGKSYLGIGGGADVDAFGNLSKSQIVMLMSYFNAFKEMGYKANKTDKQRARMAKGKRIVGHMQPSPYKKINGVVYFMSRGKGWFVGQGKGWQGGRNQPLGAGIWSKTGTHGVVVKPIMTAIRPPNYRQLIDLKSIVQGVVNAEFKRNFEAAYQYAMRTAR